MDSIIVFALLGIIFGYLLLGWHFSGILIVPNTHEHDYVYQHELERDKFDEAYWASLPKEEVSLKGKHGHKLHGIYLNQNSDKVIVLCHGYRWNLMGSIKYVSLFYEKGFNVLMFDNRAHGLSEGRFSTYGFYEKEDLKLWIDWIYDKIGKPPILGTHGESMGGASVLQHLAIDERVEFCISDCAYANLSEILRYRMRYDYPKMKLPILALAGVFVKLRSGFSLKAISPIDAVANSNVPILFIHGQKDAYVPCNTSERMFKASRHPLSELYLVAEAKHAGSLLADKENYDKRVEQFIQRVMEEKKLS